ncbi:MAG TPA: GntR family transcriptional regulator [Stellaceae bacterium]|nr:GntR family transcriptional regulator [Stellaceae bacterium]
MTASLHIPTLAHGIAEYIRAEQLPPGTRLSGRKLAALFRVSRSPIERALQLLEQHQVVSTSNQAGGYAIGSAAASASLQALGAKTESEDERLYLRLADDHTAGKLPERTSENELIRRYGVSRAAIVRVLLRAAAEGWAERLPGRGWTFIPLLTSGLTYEQICRYRIVVEPAAMLEPTFVLNQPAIESCRAEQVALVERAGPDLSPVEVFESGSRFHQVVLSCSQNRFFINGLAQANKVRRLVEYRKTLGSRNWLERCREHARIAELLLSGAREEASALMRRHLEEGAREKSISF